MAARARPRAQAAAAALLLLLACWGARPAAAQDAGVAAATGSPMEFPAPFVAVTPATALAPSSGGGPPIVGVTRNPSPQPPAGRDIPISATVLAPATAVTLGYLVGYGPEQQVPMTANGNGQYSATIPAAAFNASSMVRWYVTATDSSQRTSRSPPLGPGDRYFGTVIADPTVSYGIPVMDWWAEDVTKSTTKQGANGSSVYFLGRFYDNLFVRRKGVTALSWPKPKLKFKLADNDFVYKPQLNAAAKEKPVSDLDLNSLYYEPGQPSYMREAIAYQVLQDVGAVSAINYHIVLRQNGAFYGLYTFTENDDKYYMERNGLSNTGGVLIKPTSGSDGNLGWSVPQDQLQYSYKQQTRKHAGSYWPQLWALTQGIAGAGRVPRSRFVFDALELSETINTMAVWTMLLTQDRCTKNYLLYLDLNTSRWQMLGYDMKSALNADAGYPGGKPAPDYCTLECPQWNSPLFCDRNHPQDVFTNTTSPWTSIQGSSIGRRLAQVPNKGPSQANVNITNPDQNLVAANFAPQGPAGTFNYLVDLVTQVPATRQMLMRRIRTLTDEYYPTGKLIQMVNTMYQRIKPVADIDNQKWRVGDISLGYGQLVNDQIPTRQQQLLSQYGPGGSPALLPDAQPANVQLAIGRVDASSTPEQRFVEILNPNTFAVDVSGWKLSGPASATLKPGTVIASNNSLILAASVPGFQKRTSPPTVGQGFQVLGQLAGDLAAGGALQLANTQGSIVASQGGSVASAAG